MVADAGRLAADAALTRVLELGMRGVQCTTPGDSTYLAPPVVRSSSTMMRKSEARPSQLLRDVPTAFDNPFDASSPMASRLPSSGVRPEIHRPKDVSGHAVPTSQ